MPLIKDYKIRLLLLNEWKIKKDPEEVAKMINERFGKDSITFIDVQNWFNQFSKGETSIFENNPELKIQRKGNESTDSLLFVTDDNLFGEKMLTIDGRFMLFFYEDSPEEYFICIYDLFRSAKK